MKQRTNEKCRKFYEQELYRKLIWRNKVYRQKSEDKFLNNIEQKFGSRKDIVIVIGDWSNKQGSCIKGASTVGIGLKRLVSRKYTVLQIDEYNTSKKCCNCLNDLESISINSKKRFRLLGCKVCKELSIGSPKDEHKSIFNTFKLINRDRNSCVNMMTIIKHMIYNSGKKPNVFIR